MSSTHLIDQALDRSCMVENLLGSCTDLLSNVIKERVVL